MEVESCWSRCRIHCLPLRRYWDKPMPGIKKLKSHISIVYRWGGIETSRCRGEKSSRSISIVYRLGGIETAEALSIPSLVSKHFYCLPLRRYWDTGPREWKWEKFISIVYRWGGIETSELQDACNTVSISIVYRWGGIETHSWRRSQLQVRHDFYCLPLRRYWDPNR